jgi:hypothetical protein
MVPAGLLYIILFMETQICQLIMMERTKVRTSPLQTAVGGFQII